LENILSSGTPNLCTVKGIGKEKIEFDQQMFIGTKVWASKMCRITIRIIHLRRTRLYPKYATFKMVSLGAPRTPPLDPPLYVDGTIFCSKSSAEVSWR
jgi:hypothetical protein